MRIGTLFVLAAAFVPLVPAVGADADTAFAYHGRLLEVSGRAPSRQNHTIEFRIYDQATGGLLLWNCTRNVLLDAKGQFSVELSGNTVSGNSLASLFAENAARTLYLALSVDDDRNRGAEILPRQKLLSVPQAHGAGDSVAAKKDMAVGGALCNGHAAAFNESSADSLQVTHGVSCSSLSAASMTVSGNLDVINEGSIEGVGAIPVRGIICWNSSSIPAGWAICNGQISNGIQTPDLRDRFVVSIGSQYNVGNTGGENFHRLSDEEMPSHVHNFAFRVAGGFMLAKADYNTDFFSGSGSIEQTRATSSVGGTEAHENRPPYYALYYIMRVK